jgi:hypothetical protein
MPNTIKILRSSTAGVLPAGKTAGEPWVNFADGQFGVWNAAATPLLAVRFWLSTANYAVNDVVLSAGELFVCVTANTNSPPPSVNWTPVVGAATGVDSFNGRTGPVVLTTADVTTVLPAATIAPLMDGVAAVGTTTIWAREDHVHPSDTSRLPLAGGTMLGALILQPGPPTLPQEAAPMSYVDTMIAALRLFKGTWEVLANIPDLTNPVALGLTPGDYYMAVTVDPAVPELAPGGVLGIGGSLIGNGDLVIWDGVTFDTVEGSGLTVAEADTRYLGLGGGTLTGALTLAGPPTIPLHAATMGYVDNAILDAGTFP